MFVIGALKAGTTSLHSYLDAHPEIGMSTIKELNYFVDQYNWGRGEAWYRSQFDPSLPVRGESSPMYAMRPGSERVAGRIQRLSPDAKLIYVVRDPVERAISHYVHAQAVGIEMRPIDDALSDLDCDYVGTSRYRFQLDPYLQRFGEERLLVVSQEDMRNDRRAVLRRAFGFLGVDETFDSAEFDREWMVSAERGPVFSAAAGFAQRLGVRRLWARLPAGARWMITRRLSQGRKGATERPEPSPEVRARLVEALADDASELRKLTGDAYAGWQV